MPQVALAAAASAASAWLGGASLYGIAAAAAFGGALTLAGQALAPDMPEAVAQDRKVMVRQPLVSRKLILGRTRVSGPLLYVQSTGDNKFLHLIVGLSGNQLQSIGTVYFGDRSEHDPEIAGLVRIKRYLGTPDQQADPDLVAESNGQWTADHRLAGIGYLYVRLEWNAEAWPSGLPSISADVEGAADVIDPRTGTPGYTRNAANLIRWYLMHPLGLGATVDELDDAYFVAAANQCDETVPTEQGAEARYCCDGVIDTAGTPQANLQALLTSCGGRLVYAGGRWRLLVAGWQTPSLTFGPGDLRRSLRVQTRVSQRESFNGVKGTYVSPDNKWEPSDYPAVSSEAARLEDGGHQVWRDHVLPYTISSAAAQRLAKVELLKARQPITVTAAVKLKGLLCQAGDVIRLDYARLGWAGKPFEVVSWALTADQDEGGAPYIGVDLTLRETDVSIYDWETDEESPVDPAPNTSLPGVVPAAPALVSIAPTTAVQPDGTVVPALDITWPAGSDAFVGAWEVQYRVSGDAAWITLPATEPRARVAPAVVGALYEVRVRAVNTLGLRSAWTYADGTQATGDDEPPDAPSFLRAEGGYKQVALDWTLPQARDLDYVEIWEAAADDLAAADRVGQVRGTSFTRSGLGGLVTRWYWVRGVDRSGNAGPFNSNVGTPATTVQISHEDVADAILESPLLQDLAREIPGLDILAAASLRHSLTTNDLADQQRGDRAYVRTKVTELLTADQALAQQVTEVVAELADAAAAIQEETTARVNADGALAQQITTVQTSVDDAMAVVEENSQSIDGIRALHTIKAQVRNDGKTVVAGVGVMADATLGSEIIFLADRVAIVNDVNGELVSPFVVTNGQVSMNSAFITEVVAALLRSPDNKFVIDLANKYLKIEV